MQKLKCCKMNPSLVGFSKGNIFFIIFHTDRPTLLLLVLRLVLLYSWCFEAVR